MIVQDISRVRFEALAAYCRRPETILFSQELRWFQAYEEKILIVLIRDLFDNDFSAFFLAQDMKGRYRLVSMTDFFESPDEALSAAEEKVEHVAQKVNHARAQDDEKGKPVDFFSHVAAPEKLNKDFVAVTESEGYSPAIEIIKPMMRWYEDADGNFVEQFQTTGFDSRLWELYLFAMLIEAGYAIDRNEAIPDFSARGLLGELCVEATTVNPTRDKQGVVVPLPPLDTDEQFLAYLRDYVPIKYAGPLTAKLDKKYWERPNVRGRPLLFAIQDFHAPMSMTMTRTGLAIYLYGYDYDWKHEADGSLTITPKKVETHNWGAKEIPSGFFNLPGAENVSAVIANTSATISKFNRIGVTAGFGSKRVRMVRKGFSADPDPRAAKPKQFELDVNSAEYRELWIEGMDVYHNPAAKHALDPSMLPGAAHHRLLDNGQLDSRVPAWQPLGSHTLIAIEEDSDPPDQ